MNRRNFLKIIGAISASVAISGYSKMATDETPVLPELAGSDNFMDYYEDGYFHNGTYTRIGKIVHVTIKSETDNIKELYLPYEKKGTEIFQSIRYGNEYLISGFYKI